MKNKGIKSVDFKIKASGAGIVNWNGSFKLYNPTAGDLVSNHQLPKMRNVDPMRLTGLKDENLEKAQLIVSQNCFRHELFKNETNNLKSVNTTNVLDVLTSIIGLVRGYVIADQETKLSLKRKSALLLEDLVDTQTVLKYEQFANSGERSSTSIYSKTNADITNYEAYGSIVIEDLQFIVLEDTFGRSAYKDVLTIEQGEEVAQKLTDYLKSLDFNNDKNPKAVFSTNYVRKGAIMKEGEAGVLLNDDAIDLIVTEILDRISNIYLKQSKGYLVVNELEVDYNAGRPMRIKTAPQTIDSNKSLDYEIYYHEIEITKEEYNKKQNEIIRKRDEQKGKKAQSKIDKEAKKKVNEVNKEQE